MMDQFESIPFKTSHLAGHIKLLINDGCGIERIPNFWTLGMATYKDGYNNLDLKKVAAYNDFLMSEFTQLYRDQLEVISDIFGKPVKYMAGMPLPGFHVFKYKKEFEEPLARPHVDVPFNKYDWGSEIGHEDIFTHVCPVEIPDGGGMDIWDMCAMDMHDRGAEFVVQKARSTPPDFEYIYEPDTMVFHSGKLVHRIKPFIGPTEKWRISLQSHAVFKDGCWQLYW